MIGLYPFSPIRLPFLRAGGSGFHRVTPELVAQRSRRRVMFIPIFPSPTIAMRMSPPRGTLLKHP
jgi:hypothetical protein